MCKEIEREANEAKSDREVKKRGLQDVVRAVELRGLAERSYTISIISCSVVLSPARPCGMYI